jgi:outer membrane protein assembly factor BamD (BamD/ComL family)
MEDVVMDAKGKLSTVFKKIGDLEYKLEDFCFERHPIVAALIFGSVMLGVSYDLAQGFNEAFARREEHYREREKPIRCVPVTDPDPGFLPK